MNQEYRIVRRGIDRYYPQVRFIKSFLGFKIPGQWQRIGVHTDGFGLYDKDNFAHGKSFSEVVTTIQDYQKWVEEGGDKITGIFPYVIPKK
jgi:hypothetical protein